MLILLKPICHSLNWFRNNSENVTVFCPLYYAINFWLQIAYNIVTVTIRWLRSLVQFCLSEIDVSTWKMTFISNTIAFSILWWITHFHFHDDKVREISNFSKALIIQKLDAYSRCFFHQYTIFAWNRCFWRWASRWAINPNHIL